jgi:hypothetical protein
VSPQSVLDCATIASNPSFTRYTNSSAGPGPVKLEAYYQEKGVNNTYLLALSASGDSTAVLTFADYGANWVLQFNPDPSQVQGWQYFAPNGTLSYPAAFYPGQCSLLRVVIPQNSAEIPLTLEFNDNLTQTITLSPRG